MKTWQVFGWLLLSATVASAQSTKPDAAKQVRKPKVTTTTDQQVDVPKQNPPVPQAPATAAPTGPTSMGAIRIGMSKEAITAIPADEGVRLAGEMTPTVEKTPQPEGTERFDTKVSIPATSSPVKATLTFKDGLLTRISLNTEGTDLLLDRLAAQISERYGPGKVNDSRKDEQCIYRNGNSFTLKSGTVSTEWTTPDGGGRNVRTNYSDLIFNMCPANLRYGSTGGVHMKFLSIELTDKEEPVPKKNLF